MKKRLLLSAVAVALTTGIFAAAQSPGGGAPAVAAKAAEPAGKTARPGARKTPPPEEEEEAGVMIDSRGEAEEPARSAGQQPAPDGALPSSYGQCKGVFADGGRSLLVFESSEDGTIYFVEVSFGRNGAAWKPAGSLPRGAD